MTAEISTVAAMTLQLNDTVCLRNGGTARFVAVADLVLIVARDNYTEVSLADGGQTIVRKTLKAWEEILPASHFLRAHRTLIVNLRRVVRYERAPDDGALLYLDSVALPVAASRRLWPQLRVSLASLHHGV